MYLRFKVVDEEIVRCTLLACLPMPREYTMENAATEKKETPRTQTIAFLYFLYRLIPS